MRLGRAGLFAGAAIFSAASGLRAETPSRAAGPTDLAGALHALHKGSPERAATELLRVRINGGVADPAEGHYLVGRAWLAAKKPELAVLPLRQAARTYTELPDYALFHLGDAYLQLGRAGVAVETYERLLVDFPQSVLTLQARLKLAEALFADSQFDRARELFKQVRDAGGSGVPSHDLDLRIAECFERADMPNDAGLAYFRIWRDWPASPSAKIAVERMDAIAKAGVRVPSRTSADARWWHALALSQSGKAKEALVEIDALIASRAKLPGDWRLRRALILFKKRDYASARRELEKLAGSTSASMRPEVQYWLARSQSRGGDIPAAHKTYNKLRSAAPTSKWAREGLYKQGLLALEEAELSRASQFFELYERTYSAAADADEAAWYAAWSQFRLRRFATAEAAFKNLQERYPRSALVPRSVYWTSRAQLEQGKKDAAIANLSALARDQALTYYGMLATGMLAELGVELLPVAASETPIGVEDEEPASEETPDPSVAALPPGDPADEIGLSDAVGMASYRFHVGRAETLVRLGFQSEAALELTAARGAATTRAQKMDLARLALDAEYYHGAQYITRIAFGPELGNTNTSSEIYKLAYPKAFDRFVTNYARQYSYSPSMLWAIMREESTFRPEVVSPVGAIGLLQIMPYTGEEIATGLGMKGFTPDRLFDPEINIGFSAWYVRKLMEKYGGNEALAIASYNAGPEAVDRWLKARGDLALDEFVEEIPYTETRRYVKRVLMSYGIYEALYGSGAPKIRAAKTVEKTSLVGAVTRVPKDAAIPTDLSTPPPLPVETLTPTP